MSDTSLRIGLPFIQPSQAQKHVTHNEAIETLDSLVQLNVVTQPLAAPPGDEVVGDHYLVLGSGSGAWAGKTHNIAILDASGAWRFIAPQAGWIAYVVDAGEQVVFDGSEWVATGGSVSELQNATAVGINTVADTTNRLAVASEASLLTHVGAGHQLKLNKASAADTASLLYQSDWSGRAEMGLTGSDDFQIKTSADGTTWNTSVDCDAATGAVRFPAGAQTMQRTEVGGRFHCLTDNRWVVFSSAYGIAAENHSTNAGTGSNPGIYRENMGVFVRQGTVLNGLNGLMRGSSGEVTGCDIQIYLQTGPTDAPWTSNSDITRTLVGEQYNISVATGFQGLDIDLGQTVVSQDSFVLMFLRPVGTLGGTRFIYASLGLTYLTQG